MASSSSSSSSPSPSSLVSSREASVWTWNVSRQFGPENVAFVNDLVRVLLIQMFIQVMMYINAPEKNALLAPDFVILMTFLGLAMCFYWLVFRKILAIV
jgi:hypothetical protein